MASRLQGISITSWLVPSLLPRIALLPWRHEASPPLSGAAATAVEIRSGLGCSAVNAPPILALHVLASVTPCPAQVCASHRPQSREPEPHHSPVALERSQRKRRQQGAIVARSVRGDQVCAYEEAPQEKQWFHVIVLDASNFKPIIPHAAFGSLREAQDAGGEGRCGGRGRERVGRRDDDDTLGGFHPHHGDDNLPEGLWALEALPRPQP